MTVDVECSTAPEEDENHTGAKLSKSCDANSGEHMTGEVQPLKTIVLKPRRRAKFCCSEFAPQFVRRCECVQCRANRGEKPNYPFSEKIFERAKKRLLIHMKKVQKIEGKSIVLYDEPIRKLSDKRIL